MSEPTRRIEETQQLDASRVNETMDFSSGDTRGDVGPIDDQALPIVLGRYVIEEVLGRGGMGAVYRAKDQQLNRDVALKVPRFNASQQETAIKRFYREARAAATLSHPNLCAVYDVTEIDGVHCIAMAFIKGRPLSDYIDPKKPPEAKVAAAIISKVALAMDEAHQSGILHRDLKPANIMVDQRKEPIVMDFGLACQNDDAEETRLTQAGTLLGSPAYMSPEQLKGDPDQIGPASDQYSLGVVLYELLCGKLPFEEAASTITLLSNILTEQPRPLASIRTDLQPELLAIVERSMAKRAEDRFPSMKAFASELTRFVRSKSNSKPGRGANAVVASASNATDSQSNKSSPSKKTVAQKKAGQKTVSPTPVSPSAGVASSQPTKVEANPFESLSLPPVSSSPDTSFRSTPKAKKPKAKTVSPFAVGGIAIVAVVTLAGGVAWMMLKPTQAGTESVSDAAGSVSSGANAESESVNGSLENTVAASNNEIETPDDDTSVSNDVADVAQMNAVDRGGSMQADQFASDQAEFRRRNRSKPPVSPEQRLFSTRMFREFDLNGDQQLSSDEIPLSERARMMRGDRNNDGKLDLAEVEDMVGPEQPSPLGRPGPPRFFDDRGGDKTIRSPNQRPLRGKVEPGNRRGRQITDESR
ncbi:MAG: protein kinase [Planctomycetota bacterium]